MRVRSLLPLFVVLVACAGAPVPPVVQASPVPARPPAALAPPLQRFATPPFPPYAYEDPQRRTKVAAAFPELEKLYGRVRDDAKLEGLVIGVVMDGDLVWSHAWGYRDVETKAAADVDTVFRIGSMTKTFTATAMLALRDQGKDEALRILLNAVGRQQPQAAPNAGLLEAQRRVDELLARWDDSKAHALLDGLFYDAISDASPRAAWEEVPNKYGACRPDGSLDASNQLVGRWNLSCERGRLRVEVDLVSAEPLRIRHIVFDERHVPGPTVSRVADRVAALTAKWVDADARGLVATKAAVADLKATLAAVGKCTVAEAFDGGDDRAGSFRLACERGPRRLELKLEAHGERAATFAVTPMLAPGERCLRR